MGIVLLPIVLLQLFLVFYVSRRIVRFSSAYAIKRNPALKEGWRRTCLSLSLCLGLFFLIFADEFIASYQLDRFCAPYKASNFIEYSPDLKDKTLHSVSYRDTQIWEKNSLKPKVTLSDFPIAITMNQHMAIDPETEEAMLIYRHISKPEGWFFGKYLFLPDPMSVLDSHCGYSAKFRQSLEKNLNIEIKLRTAKGIQ